ncbi:sensor histidine kinase [Oceaniglobus trochenteri]|uniref:sensor histidine kinase n=1 Tax=Oceaniglobus trochenteri TaxID=2763260 RepID=UPI001CFFB01F|nr:ATP-binding protein [Oceaniglobus trochenteri]
MTRQTRKIALFAGYGLFALALAVAVFLLSYRSALDQLAQAGTVRLAQGADRILGKLESHRELVNVFASHPAVARAVDGDAPARQTNEFLLRMALTTGIDRLVVLDGEGMVIAASDTENHPDTPERFQGFRPDVLTAMSGALGFYHAVDPQDLQRRFYYARSVRGATKQGVVVLVVDVAQIEFDWRVDEDAIAFVDRADVVFASNRPGLLLSRDAPPTMEFVPTPRYPSDSVTPLPAHRTVRWFGHEVWMFENTGTLPAAAMVLRRFVPQLNMTELVFKDTGPARATALLQASLAAALAGLLALGLLALAQRRQRLADRLLIEEQANATLEARVEERTAQLRRAQDDLVQAGKLSALGQMSAGLSHELNQPLAVIQSLAGNARKLIARDRTDEAGANLTEITNQTDRMNRIIRNLRAFARNETVRISPVDLAAIARDAVALTEPHWRAGGATVTLDAPEGAVMVLGGTVRLQQVLVNLLTNAVDAMAESETRRITITLQPGDMVSCTITDTGCGLPDPTRVFEPFYTTKEIGASKGLGLGLSISFGIIGSFGGTLRAENTGQGAAFTFTLPKAAP